MKRGVIVAIVVLAAAGAVYWYWSGRGAAAGELVLEGNVDLRMVDLPFNNSERIAAVLAQEGDRIHPGQLLATLDTSRLAPAVALAEARVAAQQQVVLRMRHGSRPQEIAQAKANVAAAEADLVNAQSQFDRMYDLAKGPSGGAVSKQDMDNARNALSVAQAHLDVSRKALDLVVIGPRDEDIAAAEAELQGDQANLALARQQLADAELRAPLNGTVRSRLMEPGEMCSPQKPVFSIAVTDPKWVRAYVSETDLGRVRLGNAASVSIDSFPGRSFDGWVGFVSPVAEFTPRQVQTPDLRTSLVYEVRVFVHDPNDELPLGTPATVRVSERVAATQPTVAATEPTP